MVVLRCEACGKRPAEPTALGGRFCAACLPKYLEVLCAECGQRVRLLQSESRYGYELCIFCQVKLRANAIPTADRQAILELIPQGRLLAVKEVKTRLNWSLQDASLLVELLSVQGES